MKTRIELSKAYKKGIEVERERILKLIGKILHIPLSATFFTGECFEKQIQELKQKIQEK
jgi:hypothetical protein